MSCGPSGLNSGFAEVNVKFPDVLLLFPEKLALHHLVSSDSEHNVDTTETVIFVLEWEWIGTVTLLGPAHVKRKEQPLLQIDEGIQVGDGR